MSNYAPTHFEVSSFHGYFPRTERVTSIISSFLKLHPHTLVSVQKLESDFQLSYQNSFYYYTRARFNYLALLQPLSFLASYIIQFHLVIIYLSSCLVSTWSKRIEGKQTINITILSLTWYAQLNCVIWSRGWVVVGLYKWPQSFSHNCTALHSISGWGLPLSTMHGRMEILCTLS